MCLTEHFFARAIERAKYLDAYLEREGKPIGPLHGLPISLKDSFCLEGIQSTIGYVSFLEHPPAKCNSALVDMLQDLGAVFYVKTNIPQTMMVIEISYQPILDPRPLAPNTMDIDWRFRK